MFQANPCDKRSAEDEVKQPFVGNGEDDEHRRESQKQDDEAVKIMTVGLAAMEKRESERCNLNDISLVLEMHRFYRK